MAANPDEYVNEVTISNDGKAIEGVSIIGVLVASGKKMDADATDKHIDTTGFNRIILDCTDCTTEMVFAVDEDATTATKPIYVKNGKSIDLYVNGKSLHYSGAGTFRYTLTR